MRFAQRMSRTPRRGTLVASIAASSLALVGGLTGCGSDTQEDLGSVCGYYVDPGQEGSDEGDFIPVDQQYCENGGRAYRDNDGHDHSTFVFMGGGYNYNNYPVGQQTHYSRSGVGALSAPIRSSNTGAITSTLKGTRIGTTSSNLGKVTVRGGGFGGFGKGGFGG